MQKSPEHSDALYLRAFKAMDEAYKLRRASQELRERYADIHDGIERCSERRRLRRLRIA
jgi:hypothetical protein